MPLGIEKNTLERIVKKSLKFEERLGKGKTAFTPAIKKRRK